jgi:oligopeptide transport system permease protein
VLMFTARRFGQGLLVIIAATFLLHVGVLQLGDPFKTLGEKTLPPEIQASLHAHFGRDKPFFVQYLIYVKDLFTGDLGIDFDQRRQVSELLGPAALNTARLAVLAILINVVIGLFAGIVAAVWKDSFVDTLVSVSTILVLCTPLFTIAVFLRANLSGLHVGGFEVFPQLPHEFGVTVPWFKEILLPAFSLALIDLAFVARLMRASMLEVLSENYLMTARAKGLPERVVIFRHAARNALIPAVNHIGINLGILLGGAVVVESVFQYPGLGNLFLGALQSANAPIILAVAVLATITFVTLNALVDVLCAYLDPRIRVS